MKTLILLLALISAACAKKESDFQYCPSGEALEATNGQPTILVIGDSISIGYTPTIANALAANHQVVHNPCNAMTSTWTASQIDHWLDSRPTFEAIVWNNTLWDIADWVNTSDADYIANLHYIAQKIKAKTSQPMFNLGTEVLPGTPHRIDADVVHKNDLAIIVMAQEGIPVLDLHTFSQTLANDHAGPGDAHFNALGYSLLGATVLNELNVLYGIQ